MPVTWMWWHTGHEGAMWEDRKENATFHCSCTIPQTLGPIRIMHNLLCWCSLTEINRTTKPKRCYICLQHGLINIWSPLLKRTAQKKNCCFSVAQLCLTLRPHGLQHIRLPCPSPPLGPCLNSCPLSQWCHPTISSVVPFSSYFQYFPLLYKGNHRLPFYSKVGSNSSA